MTLDRRVAERHDVWLPFEIEGREAQTNDYVENLSIHGAYVRTLEPAPLGTRLKITLLAPRTRRPFRFDAEVRRVIEPEQAAAEEYPPGMGVAFLDLGGGDYRPAVVEILQELQALTQEALPDVEVEATDEIPTDGGLQPELAEALARLEQFLEQARGRNYYEILGIDAASATPATVKKHYHRRSKEFHPDRFHRVRSTEGPEESAQEAHRRRQIDAKVEELYGLLTRAYETLKDPAKREVYDTANGIRATVEFRRATARGRYEDSLRQLARGRVFGAVVGMKVALALDPANTEIQRKLEEIERSRRFFMT